MLAALFARRYLVSPKSHSVINIISGLSVLAIAMPVAAMIILLSVFNGFETLVKSMCTAFDADLTVSASQGQTFPCAELDTLALATVPGVKALSFILEQSALIEHDGHQMTTLVRGVDDAYTDVFPIKEAVLSGEYRVRLGDLDRLVLGQSAAYNIGIHTLANAHVSIYALRRGSFSTLLPLDNYARRELDCAGIYVLDLDTERTYALTSLRLARELFDYPGRASALVIRTDKNSDVQSVKESIARIVGTDFRVQNRYELKATFYKIMTYEKWGIFFISLLVLIMASFSIVGSLAMLIVDKRRDIRTLRALGADTGFIRRIFLCEGALLSALGAVIGVTLGVSISLVQQYFGIIEIPSQTFLMQSYPVEFRLMDLVAVLVAFGLVTLLTTRLTVYSMIKRLS